jgi:hypothetical protein
MRGGGETGCDVRGKQAAVCVHVNTKNRINVERERDCCGRNNI